MPENLSREDREFMIELAELAFDSMGDLVDADTETRMAAVRLAEQFIERCGFDLKDSDQLGYEMGEIVLKRLAEVYLMIGISSVEEANL
jgi:hypothetical protein